MSVEIPQLQPKRTAQKAKGPAEVAASPSQDHAHKEMKTMNREDASTAAPETSMAEATKKAFKHAVALEDPVWLVKDLLVAIDAIARADVTEPYASALTRMVTLGENALNEAEERRSEIFHSLHRYACPDSPLYTAQKGAAA